MENQAQEKNLYLTCKDLLGQRTTLRCWRWGVIVVVFCLCAWWNLISSVAVTLVFAFSFDVDSTLQLVTNCPESLWEISMMNEWNIYDLCPSPCYSVGNHWHICHNWLMPCGSANPLGKMCFKYYMHGWNLLMTFLFGPQVVWVHMKDRSHRHTAEHKWAAEYFLLN